MKQSVKYLLAALLLAVGIVSCEKETNEDGGGESAENRVSSIEYGSRIIDFQYDGSGRVVKSGDVKFSYAPFKMTSEKSGVEFSNESLNAKGFLETLDVKNGDTKASISFSYHDNDCLERMRIKLTYKDSTYNLFFLEAYDDNQKMGTIASDFLPETDDGKLIELNLSHYKFFKSEVGFNPEGGGKTYYGTGLGGQNDTIQLDNLQNFPTYAEISFMNEFFNHFFQINSDFTFHNLLGKHTKQLPFLIQGGFSFIDGLYNIPLDYTFDEKGRMVKMEGGFWGAKGEDITIRY